jgi:hypothetical protein
MIYKVVKGGNTTYKNEDGKESSSHPFIGVGEFNDQESQTYRLVCTIDKNIDEPYQYADLIATLLNNNRLYVIQKQEALDDIRQYPLG